MNSPGTQDIERQPDQLRLAACFLQVQMPLARPLIVASVRDLGRFIPRKAGWRRL